MVGYPLGSVEAFYFDRGLWIWGSKIEAEMDRAAATAKGKVMVAAARNRVLNSYIRPGNTKGLFRDPVNMVDKKKSNVQDGMVIGGDSRGGV